MLRFLILAVAISFDSTHCKKKCQMLFADSPVKLSLCHSTCSSNFAAAEQSENNIIDDEIENTAECFANCSRNRKTLGYEGWSLCRKDCKSKEKISDQKKFFTSHENCHNDCERYWKGSHHWKPCNDQCETEKLQQQEIFERRPKIDVGGAIVIDFN